MASDESGRAWRLDPDGWKPDGEGVHHAWEQLRLGVEPGDFFQACAPWAMEAFQEVLGTWGLEGDTLYDLFGGVGLFSALLGARFRDRVLVEGHGPAVAWARRNLEGMGLPSTCVESDVTAWLPEGLGNGADLILLDPPRAGLDPEAVRKLALARAGTLVLVGCDGAAFCRDLQRLAPPWTLAEVAVLDLFPLTPHVECMALLRQI
jgi:23S rRNA (uracil1939-C5)-methyltransferase